MCVQIVEKRQGSVVKRCVGRCAEIRDMALKRKRKQVVVKREAQRAGARGGRGENVKF